MNEIEKPVLLIVEDDYENQKLLNAYLKKYFVLNFADNVDDCYTILKDVTIDMFLVDIALRGDKDGLQFVKELRQTELYKNSPIVCISAHVFPQDRKNAFDAGVDEFLPRPIYNKDLLQALKKVYKEKAGKDFTV